VFDGEALAHESSDFCHLLSALTGLTSLERGYVSAWVSRLSESISNFLSNLRCHTKEGQTTRWSIHVCHMSVSNDNRNPRTRRAGERAVGRRDRRTTVHANVARLSVKSVIKMSNVENLRYRFVGRAWRGGGTIPATREVVNTSMNMSRGFHTSCSWLRTTGYSRFLVWSRLSRDSTIPKHIPHVVRALGAASRTR
jgi:hypothetical protein